MTDLTDPATYPIRIDDIARYGDTDLNGHINNAAFLTYLESGRIRFLLDPSRPLAPAGHGFAIVRLVMDFRAEMHWGSPVEIGTAVARVGRTSFTLMQAIFQEGRCTATAESVLVLLDLASRKAAPVEGPLRAVLEANGPRVSGSGGPS
jgi:acyl-CoA thioester hydrolase